MPGMIDPWSSCQPILADDLSKQMKRRTGLVPSFILDVGPGRTHDAQSSRCGDLSLIIRSEGEMSRDCEPSRVSVVLPACPAVWNMSESSSFVQTRTWRRVLINLFGKRCFDV